MRRSTSVYTEGFLRFFILMLLMIDYRLVAVAGSKAPTQTEIDVLVNKRNKAAIKTIQSDAGEIIDCVDIYEQPAFDHPLLKNHTIQMRPSYIPGMKVGGVGGNSSSYKMAEQTWLKNGSCPEGTIPILRMKEDGLLKGVEPRNCRVEVAGTSAVADGPYYGIKGILNVWNMRVMTKEWCLSSISAVYERSLVESGWGVSPIMFGDSKPRFYSNWRDGEKGCYNLNCPGFVQVSKKYALGAALEPVSEYNGLQYVIRPAIYKDAVQEKWWLMYKDEVLGYWPTKLFSTLQHAASVDWLGRVCDSEDRGYHTTTQMGSGHFSREGYGKASFFRDLLVMTGSNSITDFHPPKDWQDSASFSSCYDVKKYSGKDGIPAFYYGGPGGPCCDGRC